MTRQNRVRPDYIAGKLLAIPDLSRAQLVDKWSAAHGQPPPKGISRRLLEYVAAYDLQSKANGGLRPTTRRKLRLVSQGDRTSARHVESVAKTKSLAPGSRLVREWHGRTYSVVVLEDGFRYDGEQYRSLSQVAHAITGARWSGPRFFGL